MTTHEFTIIASGLDPQADDFEDQFFEAGCADATLSLQKGLIIVDFAREGRSFASAIISGCEAVLRAGAKVERIEPDTLVSLTDIAERSGKTRQAISLYAKGERGEHFPVPVARVTSTSPLWDWEEVAGWLAERDTLSRDEVLRARVVKEANRSLELSGVAVEDLVRRLGALEAA